MSTDESGLGGLPPAAEEKRKRFRWLRALIRNERRRHRVLFLLGLADIAIFGALATASRVMQTLPLDLPATLRLQEIPYASVRELMIGISMVGYAPWSFGVVLLGSLAVGVLFGWKSGGYLALITMIQGLTTTLIKASIDRPRPEATLVNVLLPVGGKSFPSGHVMFYTVFFGFLFFLAWARLPRSWWRTLTLIGSAGMVLMVGPSRMYLGAHWLSDVIAAHMLAVLMLAFAIEFYLKYLTPQRAAEEEGLLGIRDRAVDSPT